MTKLARKLGLVRVVIATFLCFAPLLAVAEDCHFSARSKRLDIVLTHASEPEVRLAVQTDYLEGTPAALFNNKREFEGGPRKNLTLLVQYPSFCPSKSSVYEPGTDNVLIDVSVRWGKGDLDAYFRSITKTVSKERYDPFIATGEVRYGLEVYKANPDSRSSRHSTNVFFYRPSTPTSEPVVIQCGGDDPKMFCSMATRLTDVLMGQTSFSYAKLSEWQEIRTGTGRFLQTLVQPPLKN